MLQNYLTIAWRNMMRQKGYTLINVLGVAILLTCMGLFALAPYATEERRKEIGVRKTLGRTYPESSPSCRKSSFSWC